MAHILVQIQHPCYFCYAMAWRHVCWYSTVVMYCTSCNPPAAAAYEYESDYVIFLLFVIM